MAKKSRVYVVDAKKRGKTKQKPVKTKKNRKNNVKKKKQFGSGGKSSSGTSGKKEKDNKDAIGIQELEKNVLEYIVGQDKQVRQIVSAIYRARAFRSIKSNVLIIGNSGTGKTATISQIAKMLDVPYTIEDATKYTKEGYYGADVIEMIYNLWENADQDIERAQNGIIIIDEIDKKASDGDMNDPSGAEVLKSLHKIIEGTTVKIEPPSFFGDTIPFDTHNLIIIAMGAFPGLSSIRDKRLNRNSLGFAGARPSPKAIQEYTKQDLVQFGIPEEFMGRTDTIVEMNVLGKNELIQILARSKLSILRRYKLEYKKRGITLEYDDSLLEEIAEASLSLDTGARDLENTTNKAFENITYEILAHPGKYNKCVILPGIVKDNSRYVLS